MHLYLFVFLTGIGASFIQRVSGFGLGIFAMLFLPHFMPSHMMAATVSCLFSVFTSTYNAVKYRKSIPFKTVLPLLISALIAIPFAVRFSANVSADMFKVILGVVLIILSIYFYLFERRIKIRPIVRNGIIAGTLGGTLNGLFSTGGPPIVIYLSQATNDKMLYFAAIQFYFCITNIYATLFRIINGAFSADVAIYTAFGLVGCIAGDFAGRLVFDKINTAALKKIIYIAMLASGILMIFR